jgi:putative flippase GtrA
LSQLPKKEGLITEPAELRRFIRFLMVGGINTFVGYAIFAAFVSLGATSTVALVAATVLGIVFNFASTGRIVFGNGNVGLLPRFLAAYAVQFLLNWTALRALEHAGLSPLLAQILILPPLAVVTFLLMRQMVFKGR